MRYQRIKGFTSFFIMRPVSFSLYKEYLYNFRWNYEFIIICIWRVNIVKRDRSDNPVSKE